MIAPIFIRSETLSLKRNSKKKASVIFWKNVVQIIIALKKRRVQLLHWKNVACNYCIEKTSRACNYRIEKTSCVIVALKKRRV